MVVLAALAVLSCAAFVVVWGWVRPVCGDEHGEWDGDVECAETRMEKDGLVMYRAIAGDYVCFMPERKW
jgi:hypothetical protein